MSPPRGRAGLFVVIEGIDGAGTTTQTREVGEALARQGWKVHRTCEPSGGPVGTLLRQALSKRLRQPDGAPIAAETLALLFAADRLDHLHSELLPALDRGEVVLCDRYLLSSLAYQGLDLPEPWVEAINDRARTPDITFFLEVASETAGNRRAGRGGSEEIFESASLQSRIAQRYGEVIARREKLERIVCIDGSLGAEAVTERLLRDLRPLLPN